MPYIYHIGTNTKIGPEYETKNLALNALDRMSKHISIHTLAVSERPTATELEVVKP
ncbi:hypothetical protein D3C72_244810 [compost metagenome]